MLDFQIIPQKSKYVIHLKLFQPLRKKLSKTRDMWPLHFDLWEYLSKFGCSSLWIGAKSTALILHHKTVLRFLSITKP